VKAWGAVQVGAIVAAGAMQAGASLSGGGSPGGGGGGGGSTPSIDRQDPEGKPPMLITIELQKGALFSSEQVVEMMELINEQTKNGTPLFSTRLV